VNIGGKSVLKMAIDPKVEADYRKMTLAIDALAA